MSQLLKAEISLTFLVLIEINAESVSHEDFLDFFFYCSFSDLSNLLQNWNVKD